jgi:hypothetical protein
MTPKEKAEELYDTYTNYVGEYDVNKHAKQCALIAVDELIEHSYQVMKPFWEEVKQELENYE